MKRGCSQKLAASIWVCLAGAGCGRHYADFHLPAERTELPALKAIWDPAPNPVLGRGGPGAFDRTDALNPSVFRFQGKLLNLYSGYDGQTWRTGLAVSSDDGRTWEKRGPVLSPDATSWEGNYIAANGTALAENGQIRYWYQAGRLPQIGFVSSTDGLHWNKEPHPVLTSGPFESWDERGAADPYVLRTDGLYYMYYLGQDRAERQRIGVARSKDGLHWEKLLTNPVLELGAPEAFDEIGLGEPAVWKAAGAYWMLYTGRDRAENRSLGLAASIDGISWKRLNTGLPFPGLSGHRAGWNSRVVCDPSVEPNGLRARVWFGGGNKPQPAENLEGQIGTATLTLTPVSEGNTSVK